MRFGVLMYEMIGCVAAVVMQKRKAKSRCSLFGIHASLEIPTTSDDQTR